MTDDNWPRSRKISQLPGTRTTPQLVLARTLERASAGDIKSVIVCIEWADGRKNEAFGCDWSRMSIGQLACHELRMKKEVEDVFFGRDDSITIPPEEAG